MKKYLWKAWTVCILGVAMLGCKGPVEKNQSEQQSYKIYYVNKNLTGVASETAETTLTGTTGLLDFLLGELQSDSEQDLDNKRAIPSDVQVLGYSLEKAQVNIYFSSSYQKQGKVPEILCRAAVVRTLTQIKEIENVSFYVNEQPLIDLYGQPVGMMKASDFIEDLGGDINDYEKTVLTLYFTDQRGDKLVEESREVVYNRSVSMEKLVIEQLIKGTEKNRLYSVLPSDTKLLTIATQDGVCYVNFDSAFLSGSVHTTEAVTIYAVVNSLSELPNVNKVQITINGESNKKYREVISLENAFERNLDLVGILEPESETGFEEETMEESLETEGTP